MRKSFIFLAFILVFAMGQGAFAQVCEIDMSAPTGQTVGGNLFAGKNHTVTISFLADCLDPADSYSPTNGFKLYSPDGAGFGNVAGAAPVQALIDLGWGFGPFGNTFLWDGAAWIKQIAFPFATVAGDEVAFMVGGVSNAYTVGLLQGYNDDAITMTFSSDSAGTGKHICINEERSGVPGAVWKWQPITLGATTIFPDWTGEVCWEVEYVPNIGPDVTNCGAFPPSFDHCSPATFTFTGVDPSIPADPITAFYFEGPGAVVQNGDNFEWTWAAPDQNSTTAAKLVLQDGLGQWGDTCFLSVVTTNNGPVCTGPALLSVSAGTEKSLVVTATDDCDVMTYSVGNILFSATDNFGTAAAATPTGGYYSVTAGDNASAELFFAPVAADAGFWWFEMVVDDGDVVADPACYLQFEVIIGGAYGVEIEKIHDQLQGHFTELAVNLTKMDTLMGLGGFDILIAYDPTCLSFHQALEGEVYGDLPNCGWEYFTYRFGPYGNCGNACPSGMVQVVGMAETNDGANHPDCDVPYFPDPLADPPVEVTLFYLKFLVSNDRTFNCQLCPVRFFWYDCTNNALSNHDGSLLYLSVGVYDYDNPNPINTLDVEFPTYLGAQEECYVGHDPTKPAPEANVDFQNGGVDIICADSIDAPGDININGIAYEIADAVMFTNYFIQGPSAFGTHAEGSIAASDANMDGVPLTVSDLVYLIRVVVGDALPYNKVNTLAAAYTFESGVVNVDANMGAALIVAEGNVTANGLNNVQVQQGLVDGNTHILVTGYDADANTFSSFSGDFLEVNSNIISIEFAAFDGSMVNASNVPLNFEVFQNYPNPFNPTTKITFNNPSNKAWNVTIYNITGQRVDEFSGENGTRPVVNWDASSLASGIYFYKVVAGEQVETKKAVLLK